MTREEVSSWSRHKNRDRESARRRRWQQKALNNYRQQQIVRPEIRNEELGEEMAQDISQAHKDELLPDELLGRGISLKSETEQQEKGKQSKLDQIVDGISNNAKRAISFSTSRTSKCSQSHLTLPIKATIMETDFGQPQPTGIHYIRDEPSSDCVFYVEPDQWYLSEQAKMLAEKQRKAEEQKLGEEAKDKDEEEAPKLDDDVDPEHFHAAKSEKDHTGKRRQLSFTAGPQTYSQHFTRQSATWSWKPLPYALLQNEQDLGFDLPGTSQGAPLEKKIVTSSANGYPTQKHQVQLEDLWDNYDCLLDESSISNGKTSKL